tara:strand:+ start:164 stop:586 length:423 start_codon:yes stop_codon:yes gene_type:complete
MKVLGELPSHVVAFESDFKGHCLKCKGKRSIRNEVYKPYRKHQILEKGTCIQCGCILRNFRNAVFYSKVTKGFPRAVVIDLNKMFGKHRARRIHSSMKYHPLRNISLAIKSLDMPPSLVASMIVNARNRSSDNQVDRVVV